MKRKFVIYQIFTRTFGNKNLTRKEFGSVQDNGVGKLNDFTPSVLQQIHDLGVTHVWFTGVIRHATCTDYEQYGIPKQNPRVVKGQAGSPYAITDYYDIDPDLAVDVPERMAEFEALLARTHHEGLKVIIDFVPNHVARQYHSIAKPKHVSDLGADDDKGKHFDAQNNFYYCQGEALNLSGISLQPYAAQSDDYTEQPAKCTGNDCFSAYPQQNDWYETIKLNYGVDYCDAGGRSEHFEPIPSTWIKMTEILLFWAAKGIDGFRCDMAEMVPSAFWTYTTKILKERFPNIVFIGEVYNPQQYRTYVNAGFDYLYDKVGMYDCIRGVIRGERPASAITQAWQEVDDIRNNMLYFLENHDEQRIASNFFAGMAKKGIPGMVVSVLLQQNPVMVYAGQEYGERGMDKEGFSGRDGRSTIFDYWATESLYKGYYAPEELDEEEKKLGETYRTLLRMSNDEAAVREGQTYDLMYANNDRTEFDEQHLFTFLRKKDKEVLLVIANFADYQQQTSVVIPDHAFDFLSLKVSDVAMTDLLTGEVLHTTLQPNDPIACNVSACSARIYKFKID